MIGISKFARETGNPLCTYMRECVNLKENKELKRVWFLAGDPTAYGNTEMKMMPQGYQEMRKSILHPENHGYIDSTGDKAAKQAIIREFGGGKPLTTGDVFIVSGVNLGLLFALTAFCQAGDNILVPQFGYPFYTDLCPSLSIQARPYKLLPEKNFQINLQHLQSLIDQKTKYIYVINPSNPMGCVFSREHMERILELADHNKIPLVVDEVYYGQVFDKQEVLSFGHLTKDVPVIVVSGMEKIYGVPGWCTSWVIIYDENKHMSEIKTIFEKEASIFLHTNVFTQKALPGLLAVSGGAKYSQRFMPGIEKTSNELFEKFKTYSCLKPYKSQATFYLAVEVHLDHFKEFTTDKELIKKLVEQQNVNVFPLSVMNGGTMHGFRMMACATKELYDEFFKRLDRFLQRHLKK